MWQISTLKEDDEVTGCFYRIKEVCWNDPSGIIQNTQVK